MLSQHQVSVHSPRTSLSTLQTNSLTCLAFSYIQSETINLEQDLDSRYLLKEWTILEADEGTTNPKTLSGMVVWMHFCSGLVLFFAGSEHSISWLAMRLGPFLLVIQLLQDEHFRWRCLSYHHKISSTCLYIQNGQEEQTILGFGFSVRNVNAAINFISSSSRYRHACKTGSRHGLLACPFVGFYFQSFQLISGKKSQLRRLSFRLPAFYSKSKDLCL